MKTQKSVVLAALIVSLSVILHGCGFISDQAIEGFLKIEGFNKEMLDEYCGAKNLYMSNITSNIWWPGCEMISEMWQFQFVEDGGKCPRSGCIRQDVMVEMDAFNKANEGTRVTYPSRTGTDANGNTVEVVSLTGWWLPAPGATPSTPRVVLQHGFRSNSNKFRTMFVAYQLRSLGFSVLVNNLRDHCYSDDSKSPIIRWGDAYPNDLLGAWDYARLQADGPIDASKVGMLGFSMGAFTALNAFGLDPQIPGVWVDAPPITPRDGFEVGFKKALSEKGIGFLANMLADSSWADIEKEALKHGVDLHAHLPAVELPQGPDTQRPIFITANPQDETVPFSSSAEVNNLVLQYPSKYNRVEFWIADGLCAKENHCVGMVINPALYRHKLCTFFKGLFGTDPNGASCGQAPPARLNEQVSNYLHTTHSSFSSTVVFIAAATFAASIGLVVLARRAKSLRTPQLHLMDVEDDQHADAEE